MIDREEKKGILWDIRTVLSSALDKDTTVSSEEAFWQGQAYGLLSNLLESSLENLEENHKAFMIHICNGLEKKFESAKKVDKIIIDAKNVIKKFMGSA